MARVYLNGEFMSLEEARVPVMDRGFLFGDGVYEVIPVCGGRPRRLAAHLARLGRSLAAIRLANPLPYADTGVGAITRADERWHRCDITATALLAARLRAGDVE